MSDRKHDAPVLAREIVKQVDDFALGAWIEAGSHFIAEQDVRIGNQFHGEAEAALLSAGEDVHRPIGNQVEPGFSEHAVDPRVEFFGVPRAHAQTSGGLDGFIDGERVVGDRELWHIADFRRRKILVLRKIAAIPEQCAIRLRDEPCNRLEQRGFPATGRSDNRHEMPFGHADANFMEQRKILTVLADVKCDVLEF